ncbi:MAG: site-specific integrase [Treponema sp.]|nr:site-specific integrase [Treponema sp.]
MDIVYIFRESAAIRIPFSGCDTRLLNLLASQNGVWDNERHEFIIRRDEDSGESAWGFPGIPCVWVNETFPVSIRIVGFWERPWKQSDAACSPRREAHLANELHETPPVKIQPRPQINYSMIGPLPLPEKFPDSWQEKLETELRSRKYSVRTLRCYIYYNRLFCRLMQKQPEDIQSGDLTRFLALIEKDREYAASSMNLAISAIKFFYRFVLRNDDIGEQLRPRHDERIPLVLSKEEVCKIFSMEKNPKHRLLLMLVYSAGLRVSEVVALKKEHVDLSRKVINVRLGKGRKDRCTILSEKAAQFVMEYCAFYGIQTWLFPGQLATRPLTIRSAQHIFEKALRRAEITKKISIHSLRHTFATHLLESGTDIRYIQALLGHANLRTTERYTHVARRSILNIKSPLDSLP